MTYTEAIMKCAEIRVRGGHEAACAEADELMNTIRKSRVNVLNRLTWGNGDKVRELESRYISMIERMDGI